GSVTNYETKLINKDGKLVDIGLTLSQLKDKEGNVIGTVGISKNITRQKMLEEELKRSNAELAGKIEEVKKLDKMKSDFLSVVSHELRTPLTSIIGFSKMILRRFRKDIQPVIPASDIEAVHSAEKISENLEIVSAEGSRLSRLINNVLDLAKIEAGKIEWNMVQCSLANICKLAVNSAQSLAEAKNLALKIEMDDDLSDIHGDQDKLLQVVTNLLSNAIKFTDQGSITCTVRNLGEKIEVQIIDTGIGLHTEDIPKMFEKFKQVGDTLTNRPKGTGLGLAICKEIIEAHKGNVWVESEYGKGSRFIFVIPAVKSAKSINIEKTLLLKEIKGKLYSKIQGIAKGHTVLVVDDEANIRDLLHQELEEAGYKVIEATDGTEALNKARQEKPDLIILDILMPGINGFDAMTILKKDVNTVNIPILIYSIIEDREKGYRLGADDYVTKTMGQEELLKAVSSMMAWPMKKQKKILIIENDESVSNTIKEILKIEGYNVITADNGEEGILKAQTELPNLIIIDGDISKLNNNEILRTLKYGKGTEDLSIIVLTGNDTANVTMESN
ncbi:MAG: response regulator, partial [Elusimicrobia bacterium]|nr:response regulator [Elusimicrobiota bacterium]